MHKESSISVPKFERLQYFYGRMLGVADLQAEQNYFREKLKLHNRCLHGFGVICGLKVAPLPSEPDSPSSGGTPSRPPLTDPLGPAPPVVTPPLGTLSPATRPQPGTPNLPAPSPTHTATSHTPVCLEVDCGLALDCEGNEIVVRRRVKIDLMQCLSADDLKRAVAGASSVYISICYCEEPVEPMRPMLADACGTIRDCAYGKLRDGYHLTVSLDPPVADHRCEPCCEPCVDPCLLLARIDNFVPAQPLTPEQIHNEVRRLISTYPFTNITAVNWTHGATYPRNQAEDILGTSDAAKGLVFKFSRPVLAETIRKGVLDIWVVEGGRGRANDIYNVEGEFGPFTTPTVTEARFRQTSQEDLQHGDRVMIMLRSAFILDECCRPVDGTNVGGLTPDFTSAAGPPRVALCASPPQRYGPWTSGNGIAPGQTFESWFYIDDGGRP